VPVLVLLFSALNLILSIAEAADCITEGAPSFELVWLYHVTDGRIPAAIRLKSP